MFKIIKDYFRLCKPSAAKIIFALVFFAASKTSFVAISFFVSSIISCVQIADFANANILATRIIIFAFVFALSETLGVFIALSEEKKTIETLERALCEKFFNKNETENKTGKIVLLSSAREIASFCQVFCLFFGNLFALVFVFVILFKFNILLSVLVLTLGTICFLLYGFLSKKLANIKSRYLGQEADNQMLFLNIIDGADYAYDYSKEQTLYEKFKQNSHELNKTHKRINKINLFINNWILFVWYAGISLIIIYMLKLLKYDYLNLSSFIICLPYLVLLISLFSALSGFFVKSNSLKSSLINVYNFLFDGNILSFGKNNTNKIKGGLEFINATLYKNEKPIINNISFSASRGQIVALEFKEKQSYYAFCNLIRRKISLDKGNINIDNINIKEFEKQTFTNNLSIISSPYYFENISILDYLKTSLASVNKIDSFLKETGFKTMLKKEKLTLSSGINSVISKDLLYLLYFMRAYLEGAEILVFFGLPFFTNPYYKKEILKIIKKIRRHKTIVVATTFKIDIPATKYYKIDCLGKLKNTN